MVKENRFHDLSSEPTGRQTLFCEEYVALLAKTYRPAATDEFTSDIPDRGFSQMTDGKFEKVTKPGSGFLVDGQLKVHVKLEVSYLCALLGADYAQGT